jgi:hypothetical protein
MLPAGLPGPGATAGELMSDTSFGYGHEQPNDSADDHNAVAFVCRQLIAKLRTMVPVKVMAVHPGTGSPPAAGTVDVLPLVSQIDGNGYGTPHGTVPGIPWSRTQGGKSAIICDPVVGDIGWISVADRDMSKVKSTKAAALPGSRRRHDLADGVYAGSILNAAPTCYVQFTTDGHFKFVDVDGNMLVSSSTGWVITPKSGQSVTINGNLIVDQNLQLSGSIQSVTGSTYGGVIQTAGNIVAGAGTAGQVDMLFHTHTSESPGSQTSAPTPGT